MQFKDKRILILGLGISGVSTIKALDQLGASIIASDLKSESELEEFILEIKDKRVELYLGGNKPPLENIDLIIKSPGIPLTNKIIQEANKKGIEVITDLELAYRIRPDNNFIVITGTNGKTTTTTLVGEFFKQTDRPTHVAGNIGVGILWDVINSNNNDVFIIEASSFQLESTKEFNPKISLILNMTPDHLDWHGSFEDYFGAKKKVFQNQSIGQYTILNYDDPLLRNIGDEIKSNLIWFSINNKLSKGIYIEDDYIVINNGENTEKVIHRDEIRILGRHNLENVLAGVSIGWLMGIDIGNMKEVLKTFPGVEHRIEYVDMINGIKFYNDSKGTNSNASTKAIEAMKGEIVLIAGGMDKGTEFDDLILGFQDKVKVLILLGETREKIKNTAIKHGFTNIYIVEDMREAVNKAYELAKDKDNILLSPGCASWDMYSSFEERGNDFRKEVLRLKEE